MTPCLVLVTRAPGSADGKTRLARGVGPAAARRLQEAFLADTLAWAGRLGKRRVLSVHPPEEAPALAGAAPGWTLAPQLEAGFGERMRGAVNAGFAAGGGPVAMIATDSPSLPAAHVERAWDLVARGPDVALGPADDGGWVLIAARAPLPRGCFEGVRWGGPHALADTTAALTRAGLRVAHADGWYDVDTAEDLRRLADELRAGAGERLPRTAAALGIPRP